MPLDDRDFIDGNESQLFQLRLPNPLFQVLLLIILDDVPTDTRMACNCLNLLGLAQISVVSLKGLGVASSMVSKWDMKLTNNVAGLAVDSWDRQNNETYDEIQLVAFETFS